MGVLADKMREIKFKLNKGNIANRNKVIKKRCDHAHTLNRLETHLKSRENEYKTVKAELDATLRKKERELVTSISAMKSIRN